MHDDVKPASAPAKRLSGNRSVVTAETPNKKTEDTVLFKTPEQVAANDDIVSPAPLVDQNPSGDNDGGTDSDQNPNQSKSGWRAKLALQWPPTKKEYIVAGAVVLVLVGSISSWLLFHHPAQTVSAVAHTAVVKPKAIPKPTVVISNLSGLPVDPTVNQRPVTAVMIENSIDARPQSGLSQASVVFEAIAEGGVTRFMALYQDNQPDNIGPIRSARPYYIEWALGFDAGYAHVGGSPDGLQDIKTWNVRDLDQFYNSGAYHRITTRDAPHNVYTAVATLDQLEASKGYNTSTYTSFVRKPEAAAKVPTASSIDLTLSGPVYNPHYDYNAATNSYNRSEYGAPQLDQNTGQQLSPKVVVAMVTPLSQGALDSSGAYYSDYNVIGSGAAYVFQDGTVTIGQWSKATNTSQVTFTDSAGKPIGLNPGQTWLTAVASASDVTYKP